MAKAKNNQWFDPGKPEPARPEWFDNFVTLHGWQTSWSGASCSWVVFCGTDLGQTGDMITVSEKITQEQFMDIINKRGRR